MRRNTFLKLAASAGLLIGGSSILCACRRDIDSSSFEDLLAGGFSDGSCIGLSSNPISNVRIGLIGLGNRGSCLIKLFDWMISQNMATIVALADLHEAQLTESLALLKIQQNTIPQTYHGTEDSWKSLADRDDIDLIIIATPWEYHAEMSTYCMEKGKHVACEVPLAYTLKDCWKIIETSERTKKHCMLLENCCFNREELWMLNMVNEGVFGELTHAEGAYIHDLRKHLLTKGYYQDDWRLTEHEKRSGNLYPTHGLSPISKYFGIGHGDYLDHLVSMSSVERNLSRFNSAKPIACGDMNTTMIRTKKGRSIMLQFDVHTGRPYSRINLLSGTKATHSGFPSKLYLDSNELEFDGHNWANTDTYNEYRDQYDHPIWKKLEKQIKETQFAHGGMDFIMMYRLIKCLNLGVPLDINVYEGALWSAISPLTEYSVAHNSQSIPIPDFTNGLWQNTSSSTLMREM